MSIRPILRRAQHSQPLNAISTYPVRALLGARWEWAIWHLHRVGLVRSRLPNGRELRLWSLADDWVSNQVFWRGWQGYEPETSPLLFRLATSAQTFLDVGAYVGFYSLVAGHANPDGRVIAFEPLPANFERLKLNVARNQLGNVECVAAAAGDREGTQDFHHVTSSLPCSSSLSHDFMKDVPGLTSTAVRVVTLDRFCAERGLEVDLMKIDTETTEPAVLRGAVGLLGRNRPDIICEVLADRNTGKELDAILRPFGYSYYLLTPEGPRLTEHIEGHPEWLNYIFTARPTELPAPSASQVSRLKSRGP